MGDTVVRIDLKKSLFILPNLFTLSSIFCGFYAIVLSGGEPTDQTFYQASLLIVFAMFFDIVDGRVARLTRTQSAFGMEIDSLADLVSFGAAPAALVYRWALVPLGTVGLGAAFAFVACGAIRLARFNVLSMRQDGSPKKPGKYIVGLPIPGAAGMLVTLIAANHAARGALSDRPWLILGLVLALSFFMVSTVRFRSFKDLRLTRGTLLLTGLVLAGTLALAVKVHVAFAMAWLLAGYLAIAIVESTLGIMRRLRRRDLKRRDDPHL